MAKAEDMALEKPRVDVILHRQKRVLLSLRKNSHGADTWSFPIGHLEFGESIPDCAEVNEQGHRFENLIAQHLLKACHYWSDAGHGNFTLTYL